MTPHEQAVLDEQAMSEARIMAASDLAFGSLGHRLDFQCEVNRILLSRSDRVAPVLTRDELGDLAEAYEAGESPEEFAAMIIRGDVAKQSRAAGL